jgi:hypothetical protein
VRAVTPRKLPLLLVFVLLDACAGNITDTRVPNPQTVSVLTQHNDNTRAGWNDNETALTTSNVNVQHFGALFTLPVDDQVYAQPLVVGGLAIGNSRRNVVYVATVHNTLYAFDGDDGRLYWRKNFTAPGMRPPTNTDMTGACGGNYTNFSGNIGIVGTPVIDTANQVIYFVARSTTGGTAFVQDLHAVNMVSGSEVAGSPVRITATYPGNGDGSVNNFITFDGQKQNQRQGLTLANGIVYVTFSSHCDWGPYHGWILGYDATTLQRRVVYNVTPNGYAGGMWESGMGMAADAQGLYIVTGNGTVGDSSDPTGLRNRGNSALKLTLSGTTMQVSSYFTPFDYQAQNDADLDYGTMGSLLIPNSSYFLTGGKDGNLYFLNKDNMGGWVSGSNQVQQVVSLGSSSNMHCQAAYYKGSAKEFIYVWSENDVLRAIPFDRGSNLLDRTGEIDFLGAGGPTGQSGAVLSVSSNGSTDGTGILWASYPRSGDAESFVSPGILRAFDANDVTRELWNNQQNAARDGAGNYAKFSPPTIANGHVYLPTFSNKVVVYGLQ